MFFFYFYIYKYTHVDESYLVAVSLASIFNAVTVAEQDVPNIIAANITNEVMNVVGLDTEWLFNSSYFDMLRKDLVFEVEHHSSRKFHLIDYAVFTGAPVWHAETLDQRAELLKKFEADSSSFGWGAVADAVVRKCSNNGVLYPARCHWTDTHMNRSAGIFARADITSMVIQDWGWHKESFQAAAQLEGIHGIFYNDYQLYDLQSGNIMWINDKPAMSMTYNYWITAGQEANVISNRINRASRNINSFNAYSVIVVHAWSHGLDDISNMVNNFDDDVRVVDPDSFLELLSTNIPHRNINFSKITKIFITIGSVVAVSVSLVIVRIIRKKKGKEPLLSIFFKSLKKRTS